MKCPVCGEDLVIQSKDSGELAMCIEGHFKMKHWDILPEKAA